MSDQVSSRAPRVIVVLLGLVALLSIAAWLVANLDANALRPRLETAFLRATGRALHIDGRLQLTLLPSPGFVADDVSIDNIPGGTRPRMLTARKVAGRIDLLALLGRTVHLDTLAVTGPDILLESVDGRPNWRFRPAPAAGSSAKPRHSPSPRVVARISDLDATGGLLTWRGLGRAGSGEIVFDRLRVQQQDRSSLTLFLAGRHRQTPFTISLASAPPDHLMDASLDTPVPFRATLTTGRGKAGSHIDLDGNLTAPNGGSFDGRVHAVVPQMADLDGIFPHAELPHAADLQIDAVVGRARSGQWRVSRLVASGRDVDLARVRPGLSLTGFTVQARKADAPLSVDASGSLDQAPFHLQGSLGSPRLWSGQAREGPVDLKLSSGSDQASVRGALRREPARSGSMQAMLSIRVPDPRPIARSFDLNGLPPAALDGALTVTGRSVGEFAASLNASMLHVGASNLPPSRLSTSLAEPGPLEIRAAFADAAPWLTWREDLGRKPHRVLVALDGKDLPAAPLFALALGNAFIGGKLAIRATLEADEVGGRLDPATIDGPFDATITDADLEQSVVQDLIGAVIEAGHLPKLAATSVHVRCAAANGDFTPGTLELRQFSLDTPLIDLNGSGRIALPSGALDLHVQPVLRFGGTGLATAVVLSGTAQAPVARLAAEGGRVGFRIGPAAGPHAGACAPVSGTPRKAPKPADILRALGLLR